MRTIRNLLLGSSLLFLVGCSTVADLGLRAVTGGGGPSLEAQVGQENTKQIVGNQSTITASGGSYINQSQPQLQSERVDNVTIIDIPLWMWLALFIALWVDSPKRWPGQISNTVKGIWNARKES